jgi:hypothetical protein
MIFTEPAMPAQKLACPHDNARFTEREAARLCDRCREPYLPRACQIVRCANCDAESSSGEPPCQCAKARLQVSGYRCPSCGHEGGLEMLTAPLACPYCLNTVEIPAEVPPRLSTSNGAASKVHAAATLPAVQPTPNTAEAVAAAPVPKIRSNFKRFLPVAALLLCAVAAVAAGVKYGPPIVERALKSLRESSPKPATPKEAQPVAGNPPMGGQPGAPAKPSPAHQAGENPDQPPANAQNQPGETQSPAWTPGQIPEGGAGARPLPTPGGSPNQPLQPANPAASEAPTVIDSFTASTQVIQRGGTATLRWQVTGNSPTVTILPGIGAVPPKGFWDVKPDSTQQYTLTATNDGESIPQVRSVVVVVVPIQPPRIVSFTADASQVQRGQTISLRWNVSGAASVRIDPDIGPVGSTGAIVVRPLSSTAYTLSASGAGGVTKGSVPVSVVAPQSASNASPVQPDPAGSIHTPFSSFRKDPAAMRLLGLVQAAMGGKRNLQAVHDWQRTERVTWEVSGGTTVEATTFVAPSMIRVEEQGGSTTVDFSNGAAGWTWSTTRPIRSSLPSLTATSLPFHSLPSLLLSDDDPQRSITLAGPFVLLITDHRNDRVYLRINPFTHLPQAIAWTNPDGSELQETYSNWRQSAGILWWFHMTRSRNRQEFLRADVMSVRANLGWTPERIASAAP